MRFCHLCRVYGLIVSSNLYTLLVLKLASTVIRLHLIGVRLDVWPLGQS